MNLSEGEKLDKWNLELVNHLIPNTIVLAIYIFLGLFGNGIVIIVYKRRFSGKNVNRYFVPYLAVSDLLASVATGSACIAYNTYPAVFFFDELCKIFWFFVSFIQYFSVLLLLIIAVQRYCRVHQCQMDMKTNRIALACAFTVSLIAATPTTVLYGVVTFSHPKDNIVGKTCRWIKDKNNVFFIIYGALTGLMVLVVVVALIGIYTRIAWAIFRYVKHQRAFHSGMNSDIKSSPSENLSKAGDIRSCEINSNNKNRKARTAFAILKHVDKNYRKQVSSQNAQVNQRVMNRFTLMFFLITMIFLICYVPRVCFIIKEAKNPDYWENLTDRNRAGMLFLNRMFIINNVANPFVYAFLDTKFRYELKCLFLIE